MAPDDERPVSKAYEFENVRKAVRAYERANVQGLFAIGDAVLQDVGPIDGKRGVHGRLEECSRYLAELGYQYEPGTLDNLRKVAAVFKPDHRADILETFPHLSFSVFKECLSDITLLDDCVELLENPENLGLRIPDLVMMSIRKKRTVTVEQMKEIVTYSRKILSRAKDEVYGTGDPGEILINIETPEHRKEREARAIPVARVKRTLAESRALERETDEGEHETLAASASSTGELVEVVDDGNGGFTYIVHLGEPDHEEWIKPHISPDEMIQTLDDAKRKLYEFIRGWHASGLKMDEAIEVFEKLDEVRLAWEQAHQVMSGYAPEMH